MSSRMSSMRVYEKGAKRVLSSKSTARHRFTSRLPCANKPSLTKATPLVLRYACG